MTILETKRLKLRHLEAKDASFIIQLCNSEGWLKYIGDRNIKKEEDALGYIQNMQNNYAAHQFGMYLMEEKNTLNSIGICGLIKRKNLPQPDLGFAVLPEFYRKGYSMEASKGIIDYSKTNLQLEIILAICQPDNIASIQLLERLGFKKQGVQEFNQTNLAIYRFD